MFQARQKSYLSINAIIAFTLVLFIRHEWQTICVLTAKVALTISKLLLVNHLLKIKRVIMLKVKA